MSDAHLFILTPYGTALLAPNDHIGERNNNKGMSGRAKAVRVAAVAETLRAESDTLRHSFLPPSVSLCPAAHSALIYILIRGV